MSVEYFMTVDMARGMMSKSLQKKIEIIVEQKVSYTCVCVANQRRRMKVVQ